MKVLSLLILLLLVCNTTKAQTKKIALKVDILGQKHPTIRYYHPVNGTYHVTPQKILSLDKSILKALHPFILIQPATYLNDSTNDIQANSLRYYIDPQELIYIDWKIGKDTANFARLDTFKTKSQKIREKEYHVLVKDYFNPFFISRFEVTNRDYREFVHWVQDSIFREALYFSDSISDEEAALFLKIPKEIRKNGVMDEDNPTPRPITSSSREVNRELYPLDFDFDYRKHIPATKCNFELSKFYTPPNKRFYKRREIDKRQLKYRYSKLESKENLTDSFATNSGAKQTFNHFLVDHELSIYPDTSCWNRSSVGNSQLPIQNMHFWHPAYDNHPVVGVSYEQAKAYCHWKQKQLEKEHPEIADLFYVDLPNTQEYEWAVCEARNSLVKTVIQDNQLITDLILGLDNETHVAQHDLFYSFEKGYTQKVFAPGGYNLIKYQKAKARQTRKKQKKTTKTLDFDEALEVQNEQNRLPNGIEFLSNNISEWMNETYARNYTQLIEAYINYHCFANPEYCESQRGVDQNLLRYNDSNGQLIMGSNWYDERYGSYSGINIAGIYPKTFRDPVKSFATVGFRCVLRIKP